MKKELTENQWLNKYYQGAIGFKIVGTGISEDGFPQLILQKGRGKTREEIVLEVSCDEEGNGAGFLFGLPDPVPAEPLPAEQPSDHYKHVPKGRDVNDLPDDLLAAILNKRLTPEEAWKAYDFRKGLDKIHQEN